MNRMHMLLSVLLLLKLAIFSPAYSADADTTALITLGKADTRARSLMAQKRWVEAARAITARSPEAQLVKAYAFLEANRTGEGLDVIPPVTAVAEPLRDFHYQVHCRLLLSEGLYDESIGVAEQIKDGGPYQWMKRRVIARALRESGRFDESRKAYTDLVSSGVPSEIPVGQLGLARLALDEKKLTEAVPLFKAIDIKYPTHWTAHQARKEMAGLVKRAPRTRSLWADRNAEERISRAEALLEKHRNTQVLEELKKLRGHQVFGGLKCRMQYAQARALRKLRKWKRADPMAESAVKVCQSAQHDLAPWAVHLAGKTAERLGAEERAADHYRFQMKTNPKHRLADDAGYFLVRHLIEDRDDLKAAKAMAVRLVKEWPHGDMTADAVFFVVTHALLKRKVKFAQKVIALTTKLDQAKLPYTKRSRHSYWQARIKQMLGKRTSAKKEYEGVIRDYPLGWYSLLSYSRLREMNRKKAQKFARKHLGQGGKTPEFLNRQTRTNPDDQLWNGASWMARLGLSSAAWKVVRGALGGVKSTLWTAAQLLDNAGAHHLSHRIMRWQLPEYRQAPPNGSTAKAWQIAYPRPFSGLVKKAAKKEGVESAFIWGVMREESSFKASAESFANAIGLMQLIMPTARHVATKAEGRITRKKLTKPKLNINLGARYLAEVGAKSGAVSFLWPAGYNAGTGALKRWLKQRRHLPLDLFVEAIPYEEARGYTKRVNASRATYGYLYGKSGADPLPYISQRLLKKKKRTRKKKRKRRSKRSR